MAGFLEKRRQDVPESTIVVNKENPVFGGLRHQESRSGTGIP